MLVLLLAGAGLLAVSPGSAGAPTTAPTAGPAGTTAPSAGPVPHVNYHAHGPFAVGEIVVRFIDASRVVRVRKRPPEPRSLVTVIRYPALGDPSQVDVRSAPPATPAGPFPLIVFGHGYDVTPAIYAQLLQAWARAGYVVAAPAFPLTNKYAPGGADESDIVNQPGDMSFVMTQMLAASALTHGILSQLVDPQEIAVAGQSDGGETALATAYDSYYQDRRVDATVVLSGAKLGPGLYFRAPSPPLLATQGTADVINLPRNTYRFFRAAPAPKFLLRLLGAPHLGPYTGEEPQLGVVEQVTVAFLDRYLKRLPGAGGRLWKAGDVTGIANLSPRR
jgi:dienelactone hydrolase